jgi:hypothetical protein
VSRVSRRSRQLIAPLTVDLLRGKRRRLLHERAAELFQRGLDLGARRHRPRVDRPERPPQHVGGVGREPEADHRVVRLVARAQKFREPRRLADDEQQDAGRERIECAGMADPRFAQDAAQARHHVVGGRTRRLVNDQQAVHRWRPRVFR